MNGLGQALATELAAAGPQPEKDDQKAHRELYQSLQRWLCRAAGGVYPSGDDVLQALVSGDESRYLHAQAEAVGLVGMAQEMLPRGLPEERGGSGVNRPLYAAAAQDPAHREPAGHAGLWFDKFCNTWRREGGAWTMKEDKERREPGADGNPKLKWLRTLTDGPVGAQEQIDEYVLRIVRLVERRGGLAVVFKTDARFVTGLGPEPSRREWLRMASDAGHPLPAGKFGQGDGSCVGGRGPRSSSPARRKPEIELLGTPGRAGRLCFLDAVPTVPVRLDADVMTPHFAGWSADDPPGDWRAPTPIPFLVTAVETRFLFGRFSPCSLLTMEICPPSKPGCAMPWPGPARAPRRQLVTAASAATTKKRPVGRGRSVTKIAGTKRNGSDRRRGAPRKGGGAAWSSRDCRRPRSSTRCEYIWRKNHWRMPANGAPSPTPSARWTSSGTGATAARRTSGPGSARRSSKNGCACSTTRRAPDATSG